jgi:hypothetical protein
MANLLVAVVTATFLRARTRSIIWFLPELILISRPEAVTLIAACIQSNFADEMLSVAFCERAS